MMEKLRTSDIYQIRSNYPIDNVGNRTLHLLYQPIIGNQSCSLYMTLISELDLLTLTKTPSLISRLSKLTGLSLEQLQQCLSKLEAIGLIQTYYKKGDNNRFLFEIKAPVPPLKFVNNNILNSLLKRSLGNQEYHKTISLFKTYDVKKDDYQNISSSFTSVFDINLIDHNKPILQELSYQDKDISSLELEYPLELFFAGLDNYQLSKQMFSSDDLVIIQQLGVMYKINALDMQELVKDSMINNHLDKQIFINKCRDYFDLKMPEIFNEIHHKQSLKNQSNGGKTGINKHIAYLESTTPYELLKDKQGGKEPLKKDLQVVESILTTLQLEPGVMNVLIELTLSQCDNTLPRRFMETRASQWKRKKITSVSDAISESKAYLKYRHNKNIDDDNYQEVVSNDNQEIIDDDEMKEILSTFD